MPMSEPLVSAIVPTRNSVRFLAQCLSSIRAQTYPRIELIVVDNNSTDQTRTIAEQFADRVLVLGPERSSQMNVGARTARGDWIYIIGSDFVLEPDVVEQAVQTAERDSLDAILIHNRSDPSASVWARARSFEREMYRGDTLNVAVRFVRRTLFLTLGGLDENLVAGEDYDFHARVLASGARVGWIDAAELHLGEPRSAMDVIRKHFLYGAELRKYVRKHGVHAMVQLNPVRPAFIHNRSRFAAEPRSAVLLAAYLGLKYSAGLAGFLIGRTQEERARVKRQRSV